jgi:hypothetical protein
MNKNDGLNDALQVMQGQGQGVWLLALWGMECLPGLLARSLIAPSPEDVELLRLFKLTAAHIANAPPDRPPLCLTCDFEFRNTPDTRPEIIAVLKPSVPAPKRALVQAICSNCGKHDPAELQQMVLNAYGRHLGMGNVRHFLPRVAGHA